METKGRVLKGDERTLVLFQALLDQGMSVQDIFLLLKLEDKDDFLNRNNLADKLGNRTALQCEIGKQIKKLAMENRNKMDGNMKYINLRETNKEVFRDTMKWVSEETELETAVESSVNNQFVWKQGEDFPVETSERTADRKTRIFTSPKRTFEAAEFHAKAGKKVAVLNFANNHHVGGGVWGGANAQEECLCRCSTLYSCISDTKMMDDFYGYHSRLFDEGKIDFAGNDDLIYTPDVVVCKTDAPVPERMDKKDWYKVDVITCAAPDLHGLWIDDEKQYEIHRARFTAILEAAKRMGVEVLILGAFGCGAFRNKPEIVAHAAHDALECYKGIFETVEFAVFATNRNTCNYEEFVKVFGEEK